MLCIPTLTNGQIDNTGCVGASFGVDAGLYSGSIEYGNGSPASGSADWFAGGSGRGTISEANTALLTSLLMAGGNPLYEERLANGPNSIENGQILLNAVFARDYFGGSGQIDITSFETSSKNGEDPAIWDIGQANVLGKNDIINVAGHMLRNGVGLTDDLWFFGIINRAEPGGSAYMDFEFFVEDVGVVSTPVPGDPGEGYFTSGGPDLGHTAYKFYPNGEIESIGDFIFNTSLVNGGVNPVVEIRIWVSYQDYTTINPVNFSWGSEYDGAFTGSPYGYASIIPNNSFDACGYVNSNNERPSAPPWGTLNTKSNSYGTSYQDYSVLELGLNLSLVGLDYTDAIGADPCFFPVNSYLVKTRTSASFTSQLKDYTGPYAWGPPEISGEIVGPNLIACDHPIVTIEGITDRDDLNFHWTTTNGNIISDPFLQSILVDEPGTYTLVATLPTGCDLDSWSVDVGMDPDKPFFSDIQSETTVSCNGNDGSIDLTVVGGSPPFSFSWSHGASVEDPGNLTPGTYTVTITDAVGCTAESETITIIPENPANISHVSNDIICYGENSGIH